MDSNVVSTEEPDEHESASDLSKLSRRKTLVSLLGIGGVGVLGASRRTAASSPRARRPWKQNVDAQGYDLLNLGALTMADNSKEITDFAGRNLSIGNDGELNAIDVSPWQDTDGDGLIETPDMDGIDVRETETDGLTVGDGNPVTGVWGDTGELVPLSQYRMSRVATEGVIYESSDTEIVVPFGSFSYTNIEQIHVSLVGILDPGLPGSTVSARIYDQTTETPLTDSEIQFQSTQQTGRMPVDGPKVAYDPEEPREFKIQVKQDESMFVGYIESPTIQVWGEIV